MPDFDFNDLVGEELDFYGVDGNCFKLDETVYEAIEDNGVDYDVAIVEDPKLTFGLPMARVIIEHDTDYLDDGVSRWWTADFYRLHDLHDYHCWLEFGILTPSDDSLPVFVFEYTPKVTQEL